MYKSIFAIKIALKALTFVHSLRKVHGIAMDRMTERFFFFSFELSFLFPLL